VNPTGNSGSRTVTAGTTTLDDLFERRMKTLGLFGGPAAALAVYAANPGGHAAEGRRLLAVLALTIAYWVTEAIPLPATALLASALCVILGVAPVKAVLAPYADPVIFLFVGSFLLAEAFKKYGLDRRVAARLLGRGRFARTPPGRLLGIGASSALVSTCLSNTATAALMTPIAVGAVTGTGEGRSSRHDGAPTGWTSGMLLMVAYGASVGGMATLIGTPPNLLVAGFLERLTGTKVGFVDWLLFGAPIATVLFFASLFWTWLVLARTSSGDRTAPDASPAVASPPVTPGTIAGARITMAAFGLAALLWTAPAIAALVYGSESSLAGTLAAHLPESAVALLCAALLFLAPTDWRRRRFALTWDDGRQVNWGIILLFGGGLSLGTLADSTGVAAWIGRGLSDIGLARSDAGLLFCSVALTIVVSEFASNTAACGLLVPMVIAAAHAAGLDPIRPALGVGLAATCGFIFPVSTPPNAIVFGTGLVPLRRMIRVGALLDLTALGVVWGGLLLLGPWLPGR
jgi:solute carrier family 13 (sodium-dependent dicarboxylate transporter), member 2/3/5